jgi:tol-pal system protein YbgF
MTVTIKRQRASTNSGVFVASLALLSAGLAMPVSAQQQPGGYAQPGATAPAKSAAAKSTKSAPAAKAESSEPARGGEAGLRQRVEQLEEQLVDLQVVIGTLESLAKTGGGGTASPAGRQGNPAFATSPDAARLDSMETQIRALTAQVEQLTDQLRSGGARSGVAPVGRPPAGAPITGFGSTVVQPGDTSQPAPQVAAAPLPRNPEPPPAPSGPPADPAGAKPLYEQAYGYLLQQDYGAAEAAFQDFLQKYPSDSLAGNAQYWLGESYFVRGNYKTAANAFLKGYQQYGRSVKAPDSLLKLAMSLDRLGQKDAACSSFNELSTRFPQAPTHVRTRADSERRRLGCG